MLAIQNAKYVNTVLIVTTIIGLCSNIGAIVLMIIKQYVGFGVYNNPIVCTLSGSTYATSKYVQSYYINSSDAGQVFGIIGGTAALIMLISFRMKLPRPSQQQQKQQQLQWSNKFHYSLFILFAVSIIGLLVPTGYFFAFILQLPKSMICSNSVAFQWIIVAILSVVALGIYVFNIVYLLKISYQTQETNKEEKPIETKVSEKKQSKVEHKQVKQNQQQAQKDRNGVNDKPEIQEEVPISSHLDAFHNQSFKQEPNENHLINNSINQQMREPLLTHKNSKARFSEDQYERFQQLRKLRKQQEEKIQDLENKKRMLEYEAKQKSIQYNTVTAQEKPKTQSQKDKANGNQTIINIHLASSQPNQQPVVIQQNQKKQPRKEEVEKSNISKKKIKSRGTIYQESSEEDSDRYYDKRFNSKRDKQDQKGRYNTNKKFRAQQLNPQHPNNLEYFNKNTLAKSKRDINSSQKKKLSLSHLHSVQITPSPQAVSQKIRIQQYNETFRSLNHPNTIQIQRNEQSFFKNFLEESQVKQRKNPQFNTPIKQIKSKKIKRTSEEKKNLDNYFQELNVSMRHMRSAYQQEYASQKSNYSSVLSNKEFGVIPSQSPDRNRLNSILNRQKLGNNPKTLSLVQIQQKIQKKYKNVS